MILPEDTMLENRYRLDRLLAQGGMGAVYRAFDTNLNIPVAIKENFFHTPQSIRQFEQEALILARLRHPGLPRVIHHFSFEGQQYLVMDFIEGENLWEMVKQQGQPLEERPALAYIVQVCDAVAYLHRQNPPIIHRDIKPQNIKITPDNRAVLVDFGIAKIAESDAQTHTGAQGLTPGFSPAEQYSGSGTTPASDVYALGATLYAILTGQKPPDSISLLVKKAKFIPPTELNGKLSQRASQAIMHAMQPQPQDRPQSATDWQKELEAILDAPTLPPVEKAISTSSALPRLRWLIGPEGQSYSLKRGSLTFGRAKDCDIPVNDRLASRQHATLEFNGQTCIIYDEGSANGTFVNEQRVDAKGLPFKIGDRLRIGETIFGLSATAPVQGHDSLDAPRNQIVDDAADTDHLATVAPATSPLGLSVSLASTSPVPSPTRLLISQQPVQSRSSRGLQGNWAMTLVGGGLILLVIVGVILFFAIKSESTVPSNNQYAPLPGRSRLYLFNKFSQETTFTLNNKEYKVPPFADTPNEAISIDLAPGKYTYIIRTSAKVANAEVEMGPDQSWAIGVEGNGAISNPFRVYPAKQ